MQKVVRTYPTSYNVTTRQLSDLLDQGYKVVHITPVSNGINEYIVEKNDKKEKSDE